jgi:hypothetical protein
MTLAPLRDSQIAEPFQQEKAVIPAQAGIHFDLDQDATFGLAPMKRPRTERALLEGARSTWFPAFAGMT